MSPGVASPQEINSVRMQEEQTRSQGSLKFATGHGPLRCGTGSIQIVPADEFDNAAVHHPKHYTSHPSGVECITIAEHMGFNLGNVLKYIWRADLKEVVPVQDLEKAAWYLAREIEKRKKAQ